MDKFKVDVLSKTANPQTIMYLALHQDYSEDYIYESLDKTPSEIKCGEIAVKRLLEGNRGHFGVLEHCHIVFSVGYFPHSVMQQATRHRIASFDVQSGRYSGQRIVDVINFKRSLEDVFYLRPVGNYSDRQGKKYYYSPELREIHLQHCVDACGLYKQNIESGMSEEHARGLIPFDFRQHFVMSCNLRSLLHFLDLRFKKDAQLEIQKLSEMMWAHTQDWVPEISAWYEKNRLGKARLAP
jgi:thymidylate synthase (FAD)